MKLKIFSVYDCKSASWGLPIFQKTTGEALRSFTDAANDHSSNFCRHSPDYTLFEIGSYDADSGNISQLDSKINLGTALEFKNATPVAPGMPSHLHAVQV